MLKVNHLSGFGSKQAASGGSEVPLPVGLPIWARYKASHQTEAVDALVVSLLDSSGNARHGTQANSGKRATKRTGSSGLTGNTTALEYFGNINYTLPSMAAIGAKGEIWAFIKHVVRDGSFGHRVWTQMGSAGDGYYPFLTDGKIYETFGRSVRLNAITPVVTTTNWHTYSISSEQGVGGTVLRQNNSVIHTADNTTQGWATGPILGGEGGTSYNGCDKLMCEVIIFNDHLTTQQRIDLEDYKDAEYLGL